MEQFRVGDVVKFSTQDSDPDFRRWNGRIAVIVNVIDKPDKHHDEEVLPMFRIKIDLDDTIFEAYSDELTLV